jgi:hypothetical protein
VSVWAKILLVDRKQKPRQGQFRHFSRLCPNGQKFDGLIGNKKSHRGQFRHFSRLCPNELKFDGLIGNKSRAGDNFVIFRDYVEMGSNLTSWSGIKTAPGVISSFFATVSELTKIWRVIGNKNRAGWNFVIFPNGVGMGQNLTGWSENKKPRRGQFHHFPRLCPSRQKFDGLIGNKNPLRGQFGHFSRLCRNGLKFDGLIGNKNRAGGNFVIFRYCVGIG